MSYLYTRRTEGVKTECAPRRMYGLPGSVHHAYMKQRVTPRFRAEYRKTFVRQWRKKKGLTLEQLAERVGERTEGFTHASLSRIERGLQPYSQPVLEAIADALGTEVVSLLTRDPTDPEGIWSVWDIAKPGERKVIVELAKTVLKTGT